MVNSFAISEKFGQGPGEYPMTIYDSAIDEQEQRIYLGSFGFLNKIYSV